MKKLKGLLYILTILVYIFIFTFSTQMISYANDINNEDEKYQKWQQVNQIAEEVLFLVQKNEFEASRKQLNQLSSYFLSLETGNYVDRVEQAQILIDAIIQAKESLNAVKLDPDQAHKKVLRMRLALDAVSHKKQPLWLNYYPTIVNTMDELMYAVKENNRDAFYYHLNSLAEEYEFVRPSLVISHQLGITEKLDSQIKYIMNQRQNVWDNQERALNLLESLDKDWKVAFFQKNEQSSQSFIFLMVGVGTLICSVLSYVAWRKYKGEKEIKKVIWKK